MKTNAQNFLMLACVALQEGNATEAAELFMQANKMKDMKEYLSEGLSGNVEAQTLIESLSSSGDELESISGDFISVLEEAFGGNLSSESTGADCDDDEEDEDADLDLDVADDDEDDDDDFESNSSASLFRFKN